MTIPQDCLIHASSFLNPWERASLACVSRGSKEVAGISLAENIKSLPRLHQLVSRYPASQVEPEAIAYVRRNEKLLEDQDWVDLGIQKPVVHWYHRFANNKPNPDFFRNFSVDQLNLAYGRLQDRDLELVFARIMEHLDIDGPQLNGNLNERAAIIRHWMSGNADHLNTIIALDLVGLNLTSLPEEIMQLTNLRSLSLANNPITDLPENFNLPNLRILNLAHTQITHLPQNFNLPLLEELRLAHTPITHFPKNCNLPALETLDLKYTTMTHLPDNLKLPLLQRLLLNHTPMTHLPENLNLPMLRILALAHTPMSHFPEKLKLPRLEELHLDHTQMTALPENLDLPLLKWLWLEHTPITHLPENLKLPLLQILVLAHTQVTHLPKNLQLLKMDKATRSNLNYDLRLNQARSHARQITNFIKRTGAVGSIGPYGL